MKNISNRKIINEIPIIIHSKMLRHLIIFTMGVLVNTLIIRLLIHLLVNLYVFNIKQ
jgi:hypothetical protein